MMWFYRRRKSSAVVLLHPFILNRYICLGVFYTYILLFVHDIEGLYKVKDKHPEIVKVNG